MLHVCLPAPTAPTDQVLDWYRNITLAMWIGMAPVALIGVLLAWLRMRYYNTTVLNKFKAAPPGTRAKYIYKFHDPREVEILARCCRKW